MCGDLSNSALVSARVDLTGIALSCKMLRTPSFRRVVVSVFAIDNTLLVRVPGSPNRPVCDEIGCCLWSVESAEAGGESGRPQGARQPESLIFISTL